MRGVVPAVEAALAADGVDRATVGYGLAAWSLVEGREEEAWRRFAEVVNGDAWAAFGCLAAEAELARGLR